LISCAQAYIHGVRMVRNMRVEKCDIAILGKNIYYCEKPGELLPEEKVRPELDCWLYLKQGTKMVALEDGMIDEIEWEGGGHVTSLNPEWIAAVLRVVVIS